MNKSKLLIKSFCVILIFSFFFIPSRFPLVYVFYLLSLGVFGLFFVVVVNGVRASSILFVLLPYIVSIFMTCLALIFFGGSERDVRFVFIILATPFICLLFLGFLRNGWIDYLWLLRVFVFGGFFLALLAIIQYLDFLNMNEYYYPIINERRGSSYLTYDVKRALGLYGNPNEVAFSIGVGFLCLYSLKNQIGKLQFLFMSVVFVFGVLATGSRTAVACVCVSLLLFHIFSFNISSVFRVFFVAIFLSPLAFLMFQSFMDIDYLIMRATDYSSLYARFDYIWGDAFKVGMQSPIVGHGPARSILGVEVIPDSKWLVWWIQWGVIGVFFFLCYFLVMVAVFLLHVVKRKGGGICANVGFMVSIYVLTYSVVLDFGMPEPTPMLLIFSVLIASSLLQIDNENAEVSW